MIGNTKVETSFNENVNKNKRKMVYFQQIKFSQIFSCQMNYEIPSLKVTEECHFFIKKEETIAFPNSQKTFAILF